MTDARDAEAAARAAVFALPWTAASAEDAYKIIDAYRDAIEKRVREEHEGFIREQAQPLSAREAVWAQYQRTAIAEMADWHPGFDMTGVSVSEVDVQNGSPREGDKIARNPKNHADKWLVAAAYFAENFEAASTRNPSGA